VRATKRLLKRQEDRKRKLKDAGIEYDFDAIAYVCALLLDLSAD
jgi:nucleolar protein 15